MPAAVPLCARRTAVCRRPCRTPGRALPTRIARGLAFDRQRALVEQRAGKERRSHRLLAFAAMADPDIDRLALGLEPDRAAQASAFPDHAHVSIRRPPAGNVEHRAGRERAIFRRQPRHHRREFFHQHEAALRNFRQHEVDMLLRHLVEDRGLGGGRGHGVDEDVVLRQFLAERFRQRDQAGLRGRIMRGVGIAFLAGDRGDVDDAAVVLR